MTKREKTEVVKICQRLFPIWPAPNATPDMEAFARVFKPSEISRVYDIMQWLKTYTVDRQGRRITRYQAIKEVMIELL